MKTGKTTFGKKKVIASDPASVAEKLTPASNPNSGEKVYPSYIENRDVTDRKTALKKVKLIFNNGFCTSDGMLRSISDTGARIESDDALNIPEVFQLVSSFGEINETCQRVWRKHNSIGVKFIKK